MRDTTETDHQLRRGDPLLRSAALATLAALTLLAAAPRLARGQTVCLLSAKAMYHACKNEVDDDGWRHHAICLNLEDDAARADCLDEAAEDSADASDECQEQLVARNELCDDLGEDRYDPILDPGDFETEFGDDNPYWPLTPGHHWVFESGDETITVDVLAATKLIAGLTCVVVHDVVEVEGAAVEDTDDWYALASNGDVHYCGELSRTLETFPGDDPNDPELVELEGSFKAGRDGAKSGIVMFAAPAVGDLYRQEWALGDAEDVARVVSTTYDLGADAALDALVPAELESWVDEVCDDDCVVTLEYTPLEPDVFAYKFYAPGVGVFLESEGGETVRLVSCNLAPCASLP